MIAQLASIPDGEERLLVATGRYIGEGFDDARLDTLFLALPVSWQGTLIHYTGRLHRLHSGKAELLRIDGDLLLVAAEASPPIGDTGIDRGEVHSWVGKIATKEKDDIIANLVLDAEALAAPSASPRCPWAGGALA